MLQVPSTNEEWRDIVDEFYRKCNFPNCLGAIDGKLVHVQCPIKAGVKYFNYKKTFSVNMLAANKRAPAVMEDA